MAVLLAAGSALSAAAVPPAVHLLAPSAEEPLAAGSFAELSWEPQSPFDRGGDIEEWEAFLSLDGGAHYTVRITPHLDSSLRRVRWQVPAAPTRDARLLLRFGDERREVTVEIPRRFVIAGSAVPGPALLPTRRSLQPGEAALPGQSGVVAWAEGDRHGGGTGQVVGTAASAVGSRETLTEDPERANAFAAADGPRLDPAAASMPAGRVAPAAQRLGSAAQPRNRPAASIPILLQTRRRNE